MLSEHEALNRIEVARTARRFPVVLDLLASGEVNLTAVRLLGPHLTAENHAAVLGSARGEGKAGILEIVAALAPRADGPAVVRKLPESRPSSVHGTLNAAVQRVPTGVAGVHAVASGPPSGPASATSQADAPPTPLFGPAGPPVVLPQPVGGGAPALSPQPRRSAEVRPLSPDRYKYQLTIGGATLAKLRLAKDMLRHALPSGDDEALLDKALTALLTELARKKFGAERQAHTSSEARPRFRRVSNPGSREIPAAVKRAVWVRDLGRCAFVGSDGHRCAERAFVEFHHVRPWAAGGEATVENIQLRCRRHNGYEARRFFARDRIEEQDAAAGAQGHARADAANDGSWATPSTTRGRGELVPERVAGIAQRRRLERDRVAAEWCAVRARA